MRGSKGMTSGAMRGTAVAALALLAACSSSGPRNLEEDRLRYNEVIKITTEQQLLLNIVRLRYGDSPNSLSVSAIAMQSEFTRSLSLMPFFGVSGDAAAHGAAIVLPQTGVLATDRPTITLTPLDDQEFTRQLFTPMSAEGILYLAKTTWPIETVFRLTLENLNWVSNAQEGSGPTSPTPPTYSTFIYGVKALQALQDRNQLVFGLDERRDESPIPAPTAADAIEAAKQGFELSDKGHGRWVLVRKNQVPVMKVDPAARDSAEMRAVASAFHLRPGLKQYDITLETLNPFPSDLPQGGVDVVDLESRSLLQMMYFIANGVEVPAAHLQRGILRQTVDADGTPFDWKPVVGDLLRVHSSAKPPKEAHVAVKYLDSWFYVEKTDPGSMATFSLLMELSRMQLGSKTEAGGLSLTLPVTGR